jgi:hypothetical protein
VSHPLFFAGEQSLLQTRVNHERHQEQFSMTSDSPPKAYRVFVSYVREDQETVERLAKELSAYGIKVWLDKTELKPGTRWRDAIREAISQGDFFIACFSEAYQRRSKSYMNEELTLAIEELRQRPTNRAWFIPVLLSHCEVPARSIGAGETLREIQWVELYRDWEEGVTRIAASIDPDAQIAQPARVWQLEDSEWDMLIQQFRESKCLPILGRGINYGVTPADKVFAHRLARDLGKPEWIGLPLSQVAEHAIQTYSRSDVIHRLVEEYARARLPEFNALAEPHAVLCQLPCKMFITACIDNFMEEALTRRGKKPISVIVDWDHPEEGPYFKPTVGEPVVVHIFGRLDVPKSLVITEDDHMRLVRDGPRAIPTEATYRVHMNATIWLGFDSESIEEKTMTSLFLDRLDKALVPRSYFDREFEMLARRQRRQRILLREFMAKLQLRWGRRKRGESSS